MQIYRFDGPAVRPADVFESAGVQIAPIVIEGANLQPENWTLVGSGL